MVRLLSLIAAGGAAALLVAQPATAGPRTVTVLADPNIITERVAYADLDLASRSGQHMLSRRITAAAFNVCRPSRFTSLLTTEEHLSCFIGAVSEARPQAAIAVKRAVEIAATGQSALPVVSLAVSASR